MHSSPSVACSTADSTRISNGSLTTDPTHNRRVASAAQVRCRLAPLCLNQEIVMKFALTLSLALLSRLAVAAEAPTPYNLDFEVAPANGTLPVGWQPVGRNYRQVSDASEAYAG